MEFIGQIIGFVFAVFLLRLAYKLYANDKIPSAVLVAWASVFILLCSFSWFQGWAKSFIASNISSKLTALGQQVNTVQETTTEMHKQLDSHQAEIDKHQKELNDVQAKIRFAESNVFNQQTVITNQFQQISVVQSGLSSAQTNLEAQEKELSDVEYWVQNLYNKMTNEVLSIRNNNNLQFFPTRFGTFAAIRLSQPPIQGSVDVYAQDSNLIQMHTPPMHVERNFALIKISNFNTNTMVFYCKYVVDTRETNYYRVMPKLNEDFEIGDSSWSVLRPLLPR